MVLVRFESFGGRGFEGGRAGTFTLASVVESE